MKFTIKIEIYFPIIPPAPAFRGQESYNMMESKAIAEQTIVIGMKINLTQKKEIFFLKNNCPPHAIEIRIIMIDPTPNKFNRASDA